MVRVLIKSIVWKKGKIFFFFRFFSLSPPPPPPGNLSANALVTGQLPTLNQLLAFTRSYRNTIRFKPIKNLFIHAFIEAQLLGGGGDIYPLVSLKQNYWGELDPPIPQGIYAMRNHTLATNTTKTFSIDRNYDHSLEVHNTVSEMLTLFVSIAATIAVGEPSRSNVFGDVKSWFCPI